ncbi:hypothetical protein NLJ89_g165 [Agrocybe chaxingu]|uniref:Proteasome inhibitor PI31 subunit n=1 Tax=Agrocybe chaxingu TaxID=84603 RepID=A0A9W8TGS0_9AGAR|nr:hypothetical protein NLJ89_g165 [Agrocybe chaxingu]
MTADILDPSAILALVPNLLPACSKKLEFQQDAIAALLHAALSALAFRLTAVDESSSLATSTNELPPQWNRSGPGSYTFKYKHDQSSLEFLVKVSKLGSRTVINAIALESDKVATLDIPTDDFTSPSFYPHTIDASGNLPLVHGFISSNRVSDLLSQVKLKIIQKLVPGLQKEGYTEEDNPPDAPEPPFYPHPAFPRNPLEIGRRDLDPFPMNPFAPPSLFPPTGGDGMFVGPDHPIFGVGRGNASPRSGPWGGDGFLPPLGAPPGARFDPVGPTFGPLGRGRGRNPHQGPDNDEFMPPGMGDMFM